MDRKVYDAAILNIINDTEKFKKLNSDVTLKREGQLQRFMRQLKKKGFFNDTDYNNIYPSGSHTAHIYGLPKMHKFSPTQNISSLKFRPIVSSINTYNYNLAKYLCKLLSPHLPSDLCSQDSFTFVKEITQVSLIDKYLVSYDVTSLFTNIPLEETINIAIEVIFQNNPNINISQADLKKLFKIATAQTHFLFNDQYYDQIDGVAMGSPLAPVLANLFMGYHEKQWLYDYHGTPPVYYRRYVDDIFAVFNSSQEATLFFDFLNSRHNNIQFTMEVENNGKLAFLDVLIDNSHNSSFITSVFHKTTYTGLLTNFQSFTSFSYKVGLIKCLIDRAYKNNNTNFGFISAISNIKFILGRNLFPQGLISQVQKQYLEKVQQIQDDNTTENNSDVRYFKLPYLGVSSDLLKKKLSSLTKKYCKTASIRLVFTSLKIGTYFTKR